MSLQSFDLSKVKSLLRDSRRKTLKSKALEHSVTQLVHLESFQPPNTLRI